MPTTRLHKITILLLVSVPLLATLLAIVLLWNQYVFLKDIVLLLQDAPAMQGGDYQRPAYPSAWTRMEGKGRVFYTSMGHREDVWTNPLFHDVLTGGLQWAMGEAKADTPANIKTVAPGAWTNPPYPGDPKPAGK